MVKLIIVKRIGIYRDLVEKLIPEADLKELSLRKVAKALESPEVQLDASIEGCRVMRMFVVKFRLLERLNLLCGRVLLQ